MSDYKKYYFPNEKNNYAPIQNGTEDHELAQFAAGLGGNLAGGAINTGMNAILQQRQFDEQEKLQRNAMKMNENAVFMQPQLQAMGMQNAGLNPAGVTGTGAPTIQSGAAAGSTSSMANIFTGIAEIIAAAKAPSEIAKTEAEAIKTTVEAATIPIHAEQMKAAIAKLTAETQNLTNINEVFEARNNFLSDYSQSIFTGYRDVLKGTGQFEKLSQRTKDTINKLADGEIELDIGQLEALDSIINSQKNLSAADAETLHSMMDAIITNRQMNTKSTMDAIADMPRWQQNLMKSEITEYYAMANKAKTEADWNKTREWLDQHTSDQWLIEHGMSNEIERKKYGELFNRVANLPFNVVENSAPALIMGASMRGTKAMELNSKKVTSEKPRIVLPESHGNFNIGGNSWK